MDPARSEIALRDLQAQVAALTNQVQQFMAAGPSQSIPANRSIPSDPQDHGVSRAPPPQLNLLARELTQRLMPPQSTQLPGSPSNPGVVPYTVSPSAPPAPSDLQLHRQYPPPPITHAQYQQLVHQSQAPQGPQNTTFTAQAQREALCLFARAYERWLIATIIAPAYAAEPGFPVTLHEISNMFAEQPPAKKSARNAVLLCGLRDIQGRYMRWLRDFPDRSATLERIKGMFGNEASDTREFDVRASKALLFVAATSLLPPNTPIPAMYAEYVASLPPQQN